MLSSQNSSCVLFDKLVAISDDNFIALCRLQIEKGKSPVCELVEEWLSCKREEVKAKQFEEDTMRMTFSVLLCWGLLVYSNNCGN